VTERLVDESDGQWLVETETSSYLFDFDDRTVTRYPGVGAGASEGELPVSYLRRDGEQVRLLELARCTVGERLIAVLDVRRDGVVTVRESTFVVTITRVDPGLDELV